MKWTSKQLEAIESRGSNLLVSAAAGSGKTSVLVERILRLIKDDKVDIDKLLIVTFTKAAASEMKSRINQALLEELENPKSDKGSIYKQLNLLSSASISTLHAFCLNIIRKYFYILNIDPNFRIGDTTETTILQLEALDEIFEDEYEKSNNDFLYLVEMYSSNRDDIELRDIILSLYKFVQSQPYPKKWLYKTIERFNINEEELEEDIWYITLKEYLQVELVGALENIKEAIDIVNVNEEFEKCLELLNQELNNIKNLERALESGLNIFYDEITKVSFNTFRFPKGIDEEIKEKIKIKRSNSKDIVKKIQSTFFQNPKKMIKELNDIYPRMKYLADVIFSFENKYSEKKQEKGIIDFNDSEHFALRILENNDVANQLRKKYEYIFVDEYQDSNLIQESILNFIKRNNNIFMVGDVKQSIYRFRLADPTLFQDKYIQYQNKEDKGNKLINLNNNFRSREQILEGVNLIFSTIMSKKLGEIEYDEKACLHKGYDRELINEPQIQIHLIEKNNYDIDEEDEIKNIEFKEIEAQWVVKQIKQVLNKKIYDEKQKQYRNIQYKDIVILLRAVSDWGEIYKEVLSEHGIPTYADTNSGYFDTLEIKIIVNLISLIDNKKQDIPLLSIMRSPIFNFYADELIEIRTSSTKRFFYQAVDEYVENNKDELETKLKKMLNQLQDWKEQSRYMSIEDFIWKLLIDTGFYYYVGSMPGGVQRQANLRILMDRSQQFKQSSLKGLFNFVKFIEKLKHSKKDLSIAKTLGEKDNVVKIMSIHKSKGLEFPVVFLCGMGKQFNLSDIKEPILIHKELGLGPKYVHLEQRRYCDTIAKIAIKNKIKIENLSEEMRVLYVALTRPKDLLYIVGSVKDINNKFEKWNNENNAYAFSKAKTYLDWVMPAVFDNCEKILDKFCKNKDYEYFYKNNLWHIKKINPVSLTPSKGKNDSEDIKEYLHTLKGFLPFEEYIEIDRKLSWKYPNQLSTQIPSKISVTEIKNAKQGIERFLGMNIPRLVKRPNFTSNKLVANAMERGTTIHFILQHLNLTNLSSYSKERNSNAISDEIKKQVSDMVIKEQITQKQFESVEFKVILNFFNSPLGKRMLFSKGIYREIPFNLVIKSRELNNHWNQNDENLLLQGVIDCYFEEEDYLVLIDYKTDTYQDKVHRNILVEEYRIQIEMYRQALEKLQPKKVKESYLCLLRGNEAVII